MKYLNKIFLVLIVVFIPLIACEDDDTFVEKKPSVSLVSPDDKINGIDIAPLFEWTGTDPSGKSLEYDLYLGQDSTKLFVQAKNLKETTYKLEDYKLRKDVTYFWKVVATNGVEESESNLRRFTSIPAPQTPVLLTPDIGGFVREALTFEWEPVPAAEGEIISYKVSMGKTNPPTDVIATIEDGSTSFVVDVATLDIGDTYYWKVDATDLINDSSSEVRSFKKLQIGAPDVPILAAPLNATPVMSGVVLDWNDVVDLEGDNVSYDVYMDKTISPTTLVATVSASEYTPGALDLNSAYYWYVVAKDPAGNSSQSDTFGFSYIGASPGYPIISNFETPGFLAMDEMLVWEAATGATSYDVYIDSVNPPVTLAASDITDTQYLIKNSQIPCDITDVKTFYARVVAKDGSGGETHSFPVSFTPQMTGEFTDIRSSEIITYPWVRVGTQIWLTRNLRAKALVDGTPLDRIATGVAPAANQLGYDQHHTLDIEKHGLVYSWWASREPLMAPDGWHLVTAPEVSTLESYIGEPTAVSVLGDYHGGTDTYGMGLNTSGWRHPSRDWEDAGFRLPLEPRDYNSWINSESDDIRVIFFRSTTVAPPWQIGGYTEVMMFGLRLIKND